MAARPRPPSRGPLTGSAASADGRALEPHRPPPVATLPSPPHCGRRQDPFPRYSAPPSPSGVRLGMAAGVCGTSVASAWTASAVSTWPLEPPGCLGTSGRASGLVFVSISPALALGCLGSAPLAFSGGRGESALVTSNSSECLPRLVEPTPVHPLWDPDEGAWGVGTVQVARPSPLTRPPQRTLWAISPPSSVFTRDRAFSQLNGPWKQFWTPRNRESQEPGYPGMF